MKEWVVTFVGQKYWTNILAYTKEDALEIAKNFYMHPPCGAFVPGWFHRFAMNYYPLGEYRLFQDFGA